MVAPVVRTVKLRAGSDLSASPGRFQCQACRLTPPARRACEHEQTAKNFARSLHEILPCRSRHRAQVSKDEIVSAGAAGTSVIHGEVYSLREESYGSASSVEFDDDFVGQYVSRTPRGIFPCFADEIHQDRVYHRLRRGKSVHVRDTRGQCRSYEALCDSFSEILKVLEPRDVLFISCRLPPSLLTVYDWHCPICDNLNRFDAAETGTFF
jgi:hypothetical protein